MQRNPKEVFRNGLLRDGRDLDYLSGPPQTKSKPIIRN